MRGRVDHPFTKRHYKARVYHPELGRFLQADPIGYGDGLNMYAYVGNDPVNWTDPSGQFEVNFNELADGAKSRFDDYGAYGRYLSGLYPFIPGACSGIQSCHPRSDVSFVNQVIGSAFAKYGLGVFYKNPYRSSSVSRFSGQAIATSAMRAIVANFKSGTLLNLAASNLAPALNGAFKAFDALIGAGVNPDMLDMSTLALIGLVSFSSPMSFLYYDGIFWAFLPPQTGTRIPKKVPIPVSTPSRLLKNSGAFSAEA